jgi:hypothetical protein
MHCFLNRHVFSWGATTTADPFPLSLTCDCGAVNREAATARPAPDDEALRAAAERILEAADYIIKDDQSDDEWADGMSGPGLRADLTLVARTALERGQEVERLKQIESLVNALMMAHHLHERESPEFWGAYYRLSNAMVGNPWLAPGEPNPLAALDAGPRSERSGPDEPQRQ